MMRGCVRDWIRGDAVVLDDNLIKHLGVSIDSPEFTSLLGRLGFFPDADVELPEGEFTAYLEQPAQGFALAVSDISMTVKGVHGSELPIGLNPLIFSDLFVYLRPVDQYQPFVGLLPLGLDAHVSGTSLREKFGEASWQRLDESGKPGALRWLLDKDRHLHVTFLPDGETPAVLNFGLVTA